MSDKKISALTSLAQGDVAVSTDVLPIVDTSATETKKVTAAALVGAGLTAGVTNVDINSGSIDGTTIGANSAAAGTFTNLTASGTVSFSGATVSNGGSVTTVDINGGTIDGASIGASSASTGSFTTLTTSSTVTLNGGTANGVLYLNGSKVATSGSALTFDGSSFLVGATSAAAGKAVIKDTASSNTLWLIGRTSDGASSVSFRNAADSAYNARLEGVSGQLIFEANGSEQMRLTSTGLGIGTSSPSAKVHAVNTSGYSLGLSGSTKGVRVVHDSTRTIFQGVDNTLSASYQPLMIAGSIVELGIEGTAKVTLDASGNLGIGTSSPAFALGSGLEVERAGVATLRLENSSGSNGVEIAADSTTNGIRFYGLNNAPFVFAPNATERLRLDSSGNLGLGVTPSAWASTYKAMQLGSVSSVADTGSATRVTSNGWVNSSGDNKYLTSAAATTYIQSAGQHLWYNAPSGTAGNTISFTQAMTLDASGNLGVGTTSPDIFGLGFARNLGVFTDSAASTATVQISGASASRLVLGTGTTRYGQIYQDATNFMEIGTTTSLPIKFNTDSTERARITSGGIFGVGVTNPTGAVANAVGAQMLSGGQILSIVSADAGLYVNRRTSDGTLIRFYQDDTEEGNISVSGNTVSYNAFAGSHWSQLQDGSKPDILRGTVMESINELCVWPDENNERLPKAKISDTAGSKKVYGVFMAWDNDWTTTNDMYVTAVGAFICRVNGSVTVQEGDLLESNGDGTARVQADDIIRSSTIGKVTSTVKTHQYDDGSYCVPTVLYCG